MKTFKGKVKKDYKGKIRKTGEQCQSGITALEKVSMGGTKLTASNSAKYYRKSNKDEDKQKVPFTTK